MAEVVAIENEVATAPLWLLAYTWLSVTGGGAGVGAGGCFAAFSKALGAGAISSRDSAGSSASSVSTVVVPAVPSMQPITRKSAASPSFFIFIPSTGIH